MINWFADDDDWFIPDTNDIFGGLNFQDQPQAPEAPEGYEYRLVRDSDETQTFQELPAVFASPDHKTVQPRLYQDDLDNVNNDEKLWTRSENGVYIPYRAKENACSVPKFDNDEKDRYLLEGLNKMERVLSDLGLLKDKYSQWPDEPVFHRCYVNDSFFVTQFHRPGAFTVHYDVNLFPPEFMGVTTQNIRDIVTLENRPPTDEEVMDIVYSALGCVRG